MTDDRRITCRGEQSGPNWGLAVFGLKILITDGPAPSGPIRSLFGLTAKDRKNQQSMRCFAGFFLGGLQFFLAVFVVFCCLLTVCGPWLDRRRHRLDCELGLQSGRPQTVTAKPDCSSLFTGYWKDETLITFILGGIYQYSERLVPETKISPDYSKERHKLNKR